MLRPRQPPQRHPEGRPLQRRPEGQLACSGVKRDALVAISGVKRGAPAATSGVRNGAEVAKPQKRSNLAEFGAYDLAGLAASIVATDQPKKKGTGTMAGPPNRTSLW
jgi:hypothetical protein